MKEYKFCPYCGKNLIKDKIDQEERLCCPDINCDYVFWNNPTPVVAAIVQRDDNVILVRNQGWPEKVFGLVTGFLEANENPEEGILREIQEELGVDGKLINFVGNYAFPQNNQLILAYHIEITGKIKISEELAEFKEIPIEKARSWPFGTGLALQDWLEKQKRKK